MKEKIEKILDTALHGKNKYLYSFNIGWLLSVLDLNIDTAAEGSSQILKFNYGVFLISTVALFCLINIIGFILGNYLLQKVDYESKYPRLSKFIDRYKKLSLIYISLDILICLVCLLMLVCFTLAFILKSNLL